MERLHKERNPLLLFFGITGIIVLTAYINIVSPATIIHIAGFFLLLFLSLVLLSKYTFLNMRHAVLLAGGISLYLLLRYLGLRHPLYAVLLLASVIALEYLWRENT